MKKNIVKAIGGLAVVALLTFNFVLGNNAPKDTNKSLSLKNIQVLHASAAELDCDMKNQECCDLKLPDGSTHSKNGVLKLQY